MDQVVEMMEGLAMDESSSFYWCVDLDYEFEACQFFDFSAEETEFDVREAERWFRCARDYPPAPYKMKINLNNLFKSNPAKVDAITSLKLEAVEHTSSTITTVSDSESAMHSSEGRSKDGSDLKYHTLIADIQTFRAKFNCANRLSRPSPSATLRIPTASSCGRSSKPQTLSRSESENIKRQKLEIGFSRKVSQLKHQTSFSHKTTTKATIPQGPKLMTEERALRRRSQSKVEADDHAFKALPLNKKIFRSPSFPSHKKSITGSREVQKFHFKCDN